MNLTRGIDLKKIAEKMNGTSGAELKVCIGAIYWAISVPLTTEDMHVLNNLQMLLLRLREMFLVCA
jgi:ATP-dependent 26S proteasome regulatory subunit